MEVLARALLLALVAGCGGHVDGASARSRQVGAGGNGVAGGSASGGSRFTGTGASGFAGMPSLDAGSLVGSCNALFCVSTGTALGCCVGPNGPCGLDFGNGCVARGDTYMPPQYPNCTDGMRNGSESDVDCGGPSCSACPVGAYCTTPYDCTTLLCAGQICSSSK